MELSLNDIIEVVLLQSIFLAFHAFYLSKQVDFQFSRYYLLFTLLISVTIPFLDIPMVEAFIRLPSYSLPEVELTTANPLSSATGAISFSRVLTGIYFLGFAVIGLRLMYGLIRISQIILTSPIERSSPYFVLYTDKVATSSFGPLLFWNDHTTLSSKEANLIKQHEVSHIREWHSIDILLAEILIAILWFNPLMYLYKAAMSQNHEFIADQYGAENQKKTYATLLLKSTLGITDLAIASHFGKINIKRRIMELSKSQQRKNQPIHYITTLAIATMAIFAVSFSSQVQAQSTGQDEVYEEVDQFPKYVGGMAALGARMQEVLEYPKEAKKEGTEGKVYVAFVITKEGAVTDVKIKKGLSELCDLAAVEAVSKLPDWKPGIHEGKPVNVKVVMPINFELDDVEEGQ